jgi:phenylpropionate dioxygenase-like ring-hydroxylating dioxygenase large terminal subunit
MSQCQYPVDSSFTEGDWSILANFWHPVALSEEVSESKPFATRLLDVNLVLYRLGALTAALDHCPHRGTRLSMGRIANGSLICPYHGLEFNGQGLCTRIPGDPRTTRIPDRFSIPTFAVQERYGLIWVCLSGKPVSPLPDWSAIEQEGNQRASMQAVWNTSAPRHVENFNDLAHLSIAHAGTFGCPENPTVAEYVVENRPHGLYFDVDIPMIDGSTFGHGDYQNVRSEYEVTFPYATRLTMHYSRGLDHICDAASPISARQIRVFILKSRDHDQHESVTEWVRFQEAVNEEDRAMVESQTPVTLPLERSAEWHLASDRFSVIYRRFWTGLGMGTSS